MARTCWHHDPSDRFINTRLKKKNFFRKELTEAIFFSPYKCITANTSAIWQHAAHITDQLTSPSCWTGATQKSPSLNKKNIEECSGKSSAEWTSRQKKGKTERVIGLGKRTRAARAKWNQMTALRVQTGGKTSDTPSLPSGMQVQILLLCTALHMRRLLFCCCWQICVHRGDSQLPEISVKYNFFPNQMVNFL